MSDSTTGSPIASYCRLCSGVCGVTVTLDAAGRLQSVRGDKSHAMTLGYACSKGLAAPEIHNHPERLLQAQKRMPDGSYQPIALEQALDEIAQRLQVLLAQHGADSIAAYRGTANYLNALGLVMPTLWLRALGSSSMFSTMTIDQSAKWVTVERLGRWHAGRHPFERAEVCLIFGANPLVSIQSGLGITTLNPSKRLEEARARGLKLIVVDPRQSELARHADLHLQIYPGEDVAVAAGLLHIILREQWHDAEFCARWVDDLDGLRQAVAPFTPDHVAQRAGITAVALELAARMFARNAAQGAASSGTGPNMGPHSNLAEHLIECLNVVCGRYQRAGDTIANPGVLSKPAPLYAEVRPPKRGWEREPRSRVRGLGLLMGEKMSGALADEILQSGPGQIRCLMVVGGNPASALPNQERAVRALQALDLLVVIEPFMSTTARLAHYILPPKLQYERADASTLPDTSAYPTPFAQYTPAIATPPSPELVDEWYVFWALGQKLGRPLRLRGVSLDRSEAPSSDELLDILLKDSRVALDHVRQHPSGQTYTFAAETVQAARADAVQGFALLPADVALELAHVYGAPGVKPALDSTYTHLLAVRRLRAVMNTALQNLPSVRKRHPFNTLAIHPDDLPELNFQDGEPVLLVGQHGRVPAVLQADAAQKRGVVSMSHGWGGLPGDGQAYTDVGANTARLVSDSQDIEPINAMARMTGLPVRMERFRSP